MLLTVNFLCHPTIHLTVSTNNPALMQPALQHKLSCFFFFVLPHTRTHLVDLGHAAAVSHLGRGGETQKRPLEVSMVALLHLHNTGHTSLPTHVPSQHAKQHVPSTCTLCSLTPWNSSPQLMTTILALTATWFGTWLIKGCHRPTQVGQLQQIATQIHSSQPLFNKSPGRCWASGILSVDMFTTRPFIIWMRRGDRRQREDGTGGENQAFTLSRVVLVGSSLVLHSTCGCKIKLVSTVSIFIKDHIL